MIDSSSCGLAYQNIRGISKRSPEWSDCGIHALVQPDLKAQGQQTPYVLFHPREKPELKTLQSSEGIEGQWLDGYRRIQLVSQSSDLLNSIFPGLQLIEDFVHFAEMLEDIPLQINPHLPEIMDVKEEAKRYLLERDTRPRAFSSFSQMTELHQALTEDTKFMRQKIDSIIQSLCDDKGTPDLVNCIKNSEYCLPLALAWTSLTQPEPGNLTRTTYYAGVLNVMVNFSRFTKSSSPRRQISYSKEKMQWRLLDSSSTNRR